MSSEGTSQAPATTAEANLHSGAHQVQGYMTAGPGGSAWTPRRPEAASAGHTQSANTLHTGRQDWPTHTLIDSPTAKGTHELGDPNFHRIRKVCVKGNYESQNIDLRPIVFAEHRKKHWPSPAQGAMPPDLVRIYDCVRETGLPNAMAALVPVPTALNLEVWEASIEELGGRPHVMDFLRYGFPLGYVGPTSETHGIYNHPSAVDYPHQISHFLQKEAGLGGLAGPFDSPPFEPWCHVSPLMSRPKSVRDERRVITDMTFPSEVSVNAYIVKNGIYGIEMEHSLPTIDALAQYIRHMPKGIVLSSLDIARAYKNLTSDPLDWPLLCLGWDHNYYCDITVPFGARASSYHMQTVANVIVDILGARGIKAYMYLDNLILISSDRNQADRDFDTARQLLRDLALPEAPKKAQPPTTRIKWLGVVIDTMEKSLSIPEDKLSEVLEQVNRYARAKSMTKKQLQSILGQLLHVAKCVHPARTFISRLLEALRAAKGTYININADMKADFRWFQEFCRNWNGKSYIPESIPSRDIYVDACLTGIGASDGVQAYAGQIAPISDPACNITEVEALNVIVALQTFLSTADRGKHVRIHCDNMAAVQVLQSGRARNRILLDCARAAWMVQAVLDVQVSYAHIPGKENEVADRLSRAHISPSDHLLLDQLLLEKTLSIIEPCLHVFDNMPEPLLSRSGHNIVTGQGRTQADRVTSSRDVGKPEVIGRHVHRLRHESQLRSAGPRQVYDLCPHRVPRDLYPSTSYHREQNLSRPVILDTRQRRQAGGRPSHRRKGYRGTTSQQIVHPKDQEGDPHGHTKVGAICNSQDQGGDSRASSNPDNVLWRPPSVRGGATYSEEIRQGAAPHSGRCDTEETLGHNTDKMGEKHATSEPKANH